MIRPTSCWLPLTATLEGHSPTALSKTKQNNKKKCPGASPDMFTLDSAVAQAHLAQLIKLAMRFQWVMVSKGKWLFINMLSELPFCLSLLYISQSCKWLIIQIHVADIFLVLQFLFIQ